MSIKGMTDRGYEFPQIGVIRKGAPKTDNAPGKDLDYFRVVFDEQEQETFAAFNAAYGAKPTEIRILLPFDDIARCWDAYIEAYVAGGLIYRGDGERANFWLDPQTGTIKVRDGQPYTACIGADGLAGYYLKQDGSKEAIKAKAVGRLRVIIPSLKRLAYLLVVTSSKWDVMHISDQLGALKAINGGRLAGIPLVLRRRPKMVSVPMKGKRARLKKWLISIEAEPAWVAAQIETMQFAALPAGQPIAHTDKADADMISWETDTFAAGEDENGDDEYIPATPEPPTAPTPPPSQKVGPTPGAKLKILTAKWKDISWEIATQFPQYADGVGSPDVYHIMGALKAEGVTEINDENVQGLVEVMRRHIEAKAKAA